MATLARDDPHSLAVFIEYSELSALFFGDFLRDCGSMGESIAHGVAQPSFHYERPILLIETVNTGNSIKFSFGEGWLPSVSSDNKHDILVNVPKKVGIPLVVGWLLLSGAQKALEVRNEYLDTRIKNVEVQLKESELLKTEGTKANLTSVNDQATVTMKRVLENRDLTRFEVLGVDVLYNPEKENSKHRKSRRR